MRRTAVKICAVCAVAAGWFCPPESPAQNVERVVRLQDGVEETVAAKSAKPDLAPRPARALQGQPLFFLRDGSKVAGTLKQPRLQVRTRYGVLSIPTADLVRVRFVQRVDAAVKKKAEKYVNQLGDDDFDVREEAMDAIRKLGPSVLPLVREAGKSDNDEVKNRAEILVEELEELADKRKVGDDSIPQLDGTEDEVVTTRMTVKGHIETKVVVIGSRYGELTVDVADLQAVNFRRVGMVSKKFDVLPRHQPPSLWYDPKLTLEKGQRLRIEASGIINVRNYSVSSGPSGTRQWSGNSFNNFPMLALVGKVGKRGKPFLVGPSYRGKAAKTGKLYLSIVAFSYNPGGANGKYQVKVKLQPPQ